CSETRACCWIEIEDQSAVSKNPAGRCGRWVSNGDRHGKHKSASREEERCSFLGDFRGDSPLVARDKTLQICETLSRPLRKRMRLQKPPTFVVDFQIIRECLELCRLIFRH